MDAQKPRRCRFQIYSKWTLRGRRFFFRLRAGNGEIIAQSEAYNTKAAAENAVVLIKHGAFLATIEYTDA